MHSVLSLCTCKRTHIPRLELTEMLTNILKLWYFILANVLFANIKGEELVDVSLLGDIQMFLLKFWVVIIIFKCNHVILTQIGGYFISCGVVLAMQFWFKLEIKNGKTTSTSFFPFSIQSTVLFCALRSDVSRGCWHDSTVLLKGFFFFSFWSVWSSKKCKVNFSTSVAAKENQQLLRLESWTHLYAEEGAKRKSRNTVWCVNKPRLEHLLRGGSREHISRELAPKKTTPIILNPQMDLGRKWFSNDPGQATGSWINLHVIIKVLTALWLCWRDTLEKLPCFLGGNTMTGLWDRTGSERFKWLAQVAAESVNKTHREQSAVCRWKVSSFLPVTGF